MKEFQQLILGNVSAAYYLAAFVFAFLGILASLLVHSKKRDIDSPRTPDKFSWLFLFFDNIKRIIAGLIVMFILFRFFNEISGKQLNMWWAVLIGVLLASYGVDKVFQIIKGKSSFLDVNRKVITKTP